MKIILTIVALALIVGACATDSADTTTQSLCTEEDVNNGTCQPSMSWAALQSYASQQPNSYAAINHPDATENVSGGCRNTQGSLSCHVTVDVPGTNIRWTVMCDVIYTATVDPGPPPMWIYQVHFVNCRSIPGGLR
jgi:hypothetical protein